MEGICDSKSISFEEHDSSLFKVCDSLRIRILIVLYLMFSDCLSDPQEIPCKADSDAYFNYYQLPGMSPQYFPVLFSVLRLKTENPTFDHGNLVHKKLHCVLWIY